MVDEVGQYIGDDGDLMINLQSLVEEIGIRCHGKVWVMVTSQEAIDSVVHITGNHAASLKAGGQGMRYPIRINGRQTYLYYENPNYFVEARQ